MIRRLKLNDSISVLIFLNSYNDFWMEMYCTINKQRVFLKNNLKLIEKLLRTQEFYAIEDRDITGLMFICREKGYRPYVKLLCRTENNKDFLKFLKWNFPGELFIKVKVKNSLLKDMLNTVSINKTIRYFSKEDFNGNKIYTVIGLRGTEILLKKNRTTVKEIKNVE